MVFAEIHKTQPTLAQSLIGKIRRILDTIESN